MATPTTATTWSWARVTDLPARLAVARDRAATTRVSSGCWRWRRRRAVAASARRWSGCAWTGSAPRVPRASCISHPGRDGGCAPRSTSGSASSAPPSGTGARSTACDLIAFRVSLEDLTMEATLTFTVTDDDTALGGRVGLAAGARRRRGCWRGARRRPAPRSSPRCRTAATSVGTRIDARAPRRQPGRPGGRGDRVLDVRRRAAAPVHRRRPARRAATGR